MYKSDNRFESVNDNSQSHPVEDIEEEKDNGINHIFEKEPKNRPQTVSQISENIFEVINSVEDGSKIGTDAKHEKEKEERKSGQASPVEEIR